MSKRNIRIDKKTGFGYFPKDMRDEGYVGNVPTIANAITMTLIKPGTPMKWVDESLRVVLKDIEMQAGMENDGGTPK